MSEAWLLTELHSPPLHKLIKDYIPFFSTRADRDGSPIPKLVSRSLHDAVELRNGSSIVAQSRPTPSVWQRYLAQSTTCSTCSIGTRDTTGRLSTFGRRRRKLSKENLAKLQAVAPFGDEIHRTRERWRNPLGGR